MPSSTVRISDAARTVLRELSAEDGASMQAVLEKAIEHYRRQRFLDATNAAFAALRNDPERWREELEEREAWDATLADGLEDA
jgi:predicted transcriptional regulator